VQSGQPGNTFVKIPAELKDDDTEYLTAKLMLSSRLLGRFLNGTLYNMFAAGVGLVCGRILFERSDHLPGLSYWAFSVLAVLVMIFSLFMSVMPAGWKCFFKGDCKKAVQQQPLE
jgi:hypothetical protein